MVALSVLRNQAFASGRPDDAIAAYRAGYPEFFDDDFKADRGNFQAAIDLAFVLKEAGDIERADRLVERSKEVARTFPRHGLPYRLSDVKALTLQGRTEEAFEVLTKSVESGWRAYWWLYLRSDPALAPLRVLPGFGELVARIEEENAGYLAASAH